MLTVKSKSEADRRYLFESMMLPVSAEELTEGRYIGISGKLETTLILSSIGPPIPQSDHNNLKSIMKDCGHVELKASYDEGYATFMRFLKLYGVTKDTTTYRIHTIRKIGE